MRHKRIVDSVILTRLFALHWSNRMVTVNRVQRKGGSGQMNERKREASFESPVLHDALLSWIRGPFFGSYRRSEPITDGLTVTWSFCSGMYTECSKQKEGQLFSNHEELLNFI